MISHPAWLYGPVCFNLKGKFSTMKFTYGGVDGDDGDYTLSFYGDGELIATISHSEYFLPQEAEIDVKDVYQLIIEKVENNCTAGQDKDNAENTKILNYFIAFLVIGVIIFLICINQEGFTGNRIKNLDSYMLDIERMNGTDLHTCDSS